MAILSTGNFISEARLDISDMRRVESAVRNDFDTLITSTVTGTSQGYIVRGFDLVTAGAIGSPANGLQLKVDGSSVLHIDASVSGTIFQTPDGTPNQVLNASSNTNVSGSFNASSTNYVGLDYLRFKDPSTDTAHFIWNQSSNNEIPTIAPAAQTMTFEIVITTSVWATNVLPIAIVTTDSNGNVLTITDARWNLFSLETGGISPNPIFVYPWSEGRDQSPVTISAANSSANPFIGGDKQISSLKDWMNAAMTTFLEIKGTPYWFSGASGSLPIPTIISLFQDLGNTVITGKGDISNGILPNSDPILVTTGNIVITTNQLSSLASVAGLANGDYIFGTGIPSNTTIVAISGSTITMSQTATTNGTGIGISFYSPSVITQPGQINWNDPISIRVVGSSLSYTLAANASSTDISLTDDQVAYITLIREQPVTPNLIFGPPNATDEITSVGNVVWTTGLLPGDYVKVASNTASGYYQIAPLNDPTYPSGGIINGFTVRLATGTTVNPADYTGNTGVKSQYAFGSYSSSPSPSTNRDIFIAARPSVPISKDVFWLFLREDNGGSDKVYIRFLSQEIDNGESVSVSGTTSQELLTYIGSPSVSSSKPQYVNALNPGSVPEITHLTVGAGSTISAGQYFLINSSANARKYTVWFKVSGSGSAPVVANTNAAIEVDILTADSATTVATKVANAFNTASMLDFSAVGGVGTVVVTNTSAGFASAATVGTMTTPFAISVTQVGTGIGNYFIKDGDSLTLAIKELDEALGSLEASLDNPNYDEVVQVVASGATPPGTITGPVSSGTNITLPVNSREGNIAAQYTVGKGTLQVFLNGQFLDVFSGENYTEVGTSGTPSNQIQIQFGLVVGDELEFRIGSGGGGGGSGGVPIPGPAGPQGPAGADAAGGPINISIKTGSYSVLTTDCFLAANCTSGNITFTLPASAANIGRIFYIKRIDASANTLTIATTGSDDIDGSSTQVITGTPVSGQWLSLSLIGRSSGYWRF